MTQSLIVFAALQVASLAIILAFTALESLRQGTEGFGGVLPSKARMRLSRGPRRKHRRGRHASRGLNSARGAARGLAGSAKGHRRFFDISGGLNADRNDHGAKSLRAT